LVCDWLDEETQDSTQEKTYIHVSMRNLEYVEPPKDAECWGGKHNIDTDCPDKHYNINCDKYNQFSGFGLTDWNEIVHLEVEVEDSAKHRTQEELAAAFLYELTFYGFTETKMQEFRSEILERSESTTDGTTLEDFLKENEFLDVDETSQNDEQTQ
jgi:hypothetical protein